MNKKNKLFKQMNVIIVISVIIFGEIFACLSDLYFGAKFHDGKLFIPYSTKILKFEEIYNNSWKKGFGKVYGEKYHVRPIVIFGGSYVYGYGLEDNETFASQLSEYIKKPVYNRAFQTWCVQNMLWQLKQQDIYTQIKNPETVVYMGVMADLENIYNPDVLNGLKYYESAGKLEEFPFAFMLLNYSYLYKKINHEISYHKTLDRSKTIKFFNKHVLEAKKEADKHWKNYKMIVVWYDLPLTDDFRELEQQGIKVISLDDFMKKNIFSNPDFKNSGADIHPNAKAWKLIIPEFVRQACLIK